MKVIQLLFFTFSIVHNKKMYSSSNITHESAYRKVEYNAYEVGAGTVVEARRSCCSKRAARRWVIPPNTRPPKLRASGS